MILDSDRLPSSSALKIQKAGPQSILVDQGRTGYQHIGITNGGAMDEHAFHWSNKILGNCFGASALEIALGGFECEFQSTNVIAITGADTTAQLNNQHIPNWSAVDVKQGDILKLPPPRSGVYIYLAIQHGFNEPLVLGSQSIVTRERIGPHEGRKFNEGDFLHRTSHSTDSRGALAAYPSSSAGIKYRGVARRFIPDHNLPLNLHLHPGYQYENFNHDFLSELFTTQYRVLATSNRMAIKLQKMDFDASRPMSEPTSQKNLLSEGIAFGSVQIPPDGNPIVLMKDRQTIGGYPKLGTIASLDCYALSQRRGANIIQFKLGDIAFSRKQLTNFKQFFNS